MIKTNFISDGYTEPGYIEGVKNHYLPCRFTYRPVLIEERVQLVEQFKSLSDADCERLQAEFLAKKIISWDIKDADGKTVEISTVNLLRLRPTLLARVRLVVMGHEPSDTDPQWKAEKKVEQSKLKLESALTGQSVGETKARQDEGNSEQG